MKWMPRWHSRKKRRPETKASATAPLMVQFNARQPRFTPREYGALAEEGFQKSNRLPRHPPDQPECGGRALDGFWHS